MFKKIILAEDFQGENQGIAEALREKLAIEDLQNELYCDKAFTRLKVALKNNAPYELLITDLFFEEDHVPRKLTSGSELIKAARALQPNLKIIVHSMENNPLHINTLFKEQKINGYVSKGRKGMLELINAIKEVYHNRTYVSPQLNLTAASNIVELDDFDRAILKELAKGLTKKEVSDKFKKENRTPNSESTIDKRISRLYDEFEAKNTTNLLFKLAKEGRI
ncbi:response regulator transcription factor [Maribacter sp. MJ134]|uniref:response regulator transcription factor n=1 Tax=Maribacter sp. MJ134 TaxID=2496865 RepID=UPI000F830B14|nr:response regulator transcription factor [Maribacter sp. MJ134]AZQ59781.1 response regulator transcription factor [Maribacter sp. MJ134]